MDHTKNGGGGRDRTDDLLLAKQALSQLSYGPDKIGLKPTLALNPALNKCGGPGKT